MIAKIKNHAAPSAAVNYCTDREKEQKAPLIIGRNLCGDGTSQGAIDALYLTLAVCDSRGAKPQLTHPFKHVALSFAPEDAPRFPDDEHGDALMCQCARQWMRQMGIDADRASWLLVRHHDKPYPHCHLVFSRITLDGDVWSDAYDHRRALEACRQVEREFHLTVAVNGKQRPGVKQKPSGWNISEAARCELASEVREALSDACVLTSKGAERWQQFEQRLAERGITLRLRFSRHGAHLHGVCFQTDRFTISGSSLSRSEFSYPHLEQTLGELTVEPHFNEASSHLQAQPSGRWIETRHDILVPCFFLLQVLTFIQSLFRRGGSSVASLGENREWEVGISTRQSWEIRPSQRKIIRSSFHYKH